MFEFDILENQEFTINLKGKKNYYNIDNGQPLSDWVRIDKSSNKIIDKPLLSSALNIKNKGLGKGRENSFGYVYYCGNNIQSNTNGVCLVSSVFSHGHGFDVYDKNILRVLIGFSVRKMITSDWLNEKDEYFAPNEEHGQFDQFKYDSLVYSLFNNSSEQSSLRQITYKGKLLDIKNEFFWMSAERMKELADNNGYDNLYNDARTSANRHVYNLLFGEERIYDKLSPDAKAVLDKATELVEKSIKMRMIMSNDENHLDSWDAGYAQLKLVWKEYFSDDFKEFRQLYKNMEDRMRPLVYELGFLMK